MDLSHIPLSLSNPVTKVDFLSFMLSPLNIVNALKIQMHSQVSVREAEER